MYPGQPALVLKVIALQRQNILILKGIIFTEEEVGDIWDETIRISYSQLQGSILAGKPFDTDKALREIFENSPPFAASSVAYAFNGDLQEVFNPKKSFVLSRKDIGRICAEFSDLKQKFSIHKLHVEKELQHIRDQEQASQAAISAINASARAMLENKKNAALEPLRKKNDAALEDLERTRRNTNMDFSKYEAHKREIEGWYDNHPEIQRIRKDFERELERSSHSAVVAHTVLHSKTHNQKMEIKDHAAVERLLMFQKPVLELHERYLNSCKKPASWSA